MSSHPTDLDELAQAAGEMLTATQNETLRLLEVEMQALAQMMPCGDQSLIAALPTDDAVEQGFDNMPV